MDSVFRPYSRSESLRSDRSATDRLRHRQKVREAIRKNLADIVAEESIIGKSGDKVVKVPIRGVKEYRFVYGESNSGVGTGPGNTQPGQVVGKTGEGQGQGAGPAGDQPGMDYYETEITLEDLVDILFDDLELPEMERKNLRQVMAERLMKRKGYRQVGVHVHMDKRRTAIARIRRRIATQRGMEESDHARPEGLEEGETAESVDISESVEFSPANLKSPPSSRFFHRHPDRKFHRLTTEEKPQSNAVVFCIMDTSGSMDTTKKYLARSFFFLLHQFVLSRYSKVEVVFISHHTEAKEVTEEEFFHKGESGGTHISSGYLKALQIIEDRYHPILWNIYAFHCSDGDNWSDDNPAAIRAVEALCKVANLVGYGEIKPGAQITYGYDSSMLDLFKKVKASNFQAVRMIRKEDVWPSFKELLSREREPAPAGADRPRSSGLAGSSGSGI